MCSKHLEEERRVVARLHRELELEQARHSLADQEGEMERARGVEQARLFATREQSLQSQLAAERSRSMELDEAFTREKLRSSGLQHELEESKRGLEREQSLLSQLKMSLSEAHECARQYREQLSRDLDQSRRRERELEQQNETLTGQVASVQVYMEKGERVVCQVQAANQRLRAAFEESEVRVTRLERALTTVQSEHESERRRWVALGRLNVTGNTVMDPGPRSAPDGGLSCSGSAACGGTLWEEVWLRLESLRHRAELLSACQHRQQICGNGDGHGTVGLTPADLVEAIVTIQALLPRFPLTTSDPAVDGHSTRFRQEVIQQNAQLTDFVLRISREKEDLREALGRLEGEVFKFRVQQQQLVAVATAASDRTPVGCSSSSDSLEKNTTTIHLPCRLSTSNAGDEMIPADRFHRMYLRYLRAESYRRALVYQKRYLLLVIGGFHTTEEEVTLALSQLSCSCQLTLTSNSGGPIDLPIMAGIGGDEVGSKARRRFRTATRIIQAVHRMQYLVGKWRRNLCAVQAASTPASNSRNAPTTVSYHGNSLLVGDRRQQQQQVANHLHPTTPPTRDPPTCSIGAGIDFNKWPGNDTSSSVALTRSNISSNQNTSSPKLSSQPALVRVHPGAGPIGDAGGDLAADLVHSSGGPNIWPLLPRDKLTSTNNLHHNHHRDAGATSPPATREIELRRSVDRLQRRLDFYTSSAAYASASGPVSVEVTSGRPRFGLDQFHSHFQTSAAGQCRGCK